MARQEVQGRLLGRENSGKRKGRITREKHREETRGTRWKNGNAKWHNIDEYKWVINYKSQLGISLSYRMSLCN